MAGMGTGAAGAGAEPLPARPARPERGGEVGDDDAPDPRPPHEPVADDDEGSVEAGIDAEDVHSATPYTASHTGSGVGMPHAS